MSILRRWPKRREFLAYYMLLLYSKRRNLEIINAGDVVDVLYLLTGSKRLAQRLLKTLVKQGYLERVKPLTYRVKDLDEILGDALGYYIVDRLRRRNIEALYNSRKRSIVIHADIEECEKINKIVKELGYSMECLA